MLGIEFKRNLLKKLQSKGVNYGTHYSLQSEAFSYKNVPCYDKGDKSRYYAEG